MNSANAKCRILNQRQIVPLGVPVRLEADHLDALNERVVRVEYLVDGDAGVKGLDVDF